MTTSRGGRVVSMSACYAGDLPIQTSTLPLLKHTCGKVTSYPAGHQEVSRCPIKGESQRIYITDMPPPNVNKAAHSGFETQRRRHKKSNIR